MNTTINLTLSIGPSGLRIRGVRFMQEQKVAERMLELSPDEVLANRYTPRIVGGEAGKIIHELLEVEEK